MEVLRKGEEVSMANVSARFLWWSFAQMKGSRSGVVRTVGMIYPRPSKFQTFKAKDFIKTNKDGLVSSER